MYGALCIAVSDLMDSAEPEVVEEETPTGPVSLVSALMAKKKKQPTPVARDEVTEYLAEKVTNITDNPLAWWKQNEEKFPLSARLAKKYLSLPASSAPSERIFSKMHAVVDKRRASLDPDRVERIVFIKENRLKSKGM